MGQAKQGGSILGYVIVGGVLTLLLLGGVYALRTYWSGAPAGDSGEVADNPKAAPVPAPEGNADKDKQHTDTDKPQPAQQATPPASIPKTATPPTELPQTGPVDTLLSAAVLGILIMSLGVYLQSRRLATSL
jgi:LPXTG-motif cell wall-anchored protein